MPLLDLESGDFFGEKNDLCVVGVQIYRKSRFSDLHLSPEIVTINENNSEITNLFVLP